MLIPPLLPMQFFNNIEVSSAAHSAKMIHALIDFTESIAYLLD
jgi:hypothetical protein